MQHTTAHSRRWQILGILCLSLIVIGLDNLILNLAIPSIQKDLDASVSDLQWIIDAYTLVFGGLLLLGGGLGDRFGRKRMLSSGLLIFLVFSLGAAFANSASMLIVFRTGMGVGAALIMPATLAIIRHVFPPAEQGKAIGIWAGSGALSVPLGPVLGGLLLDHFWWGSVFLINVPVVLIALLAGAALVPESRDERRRKLDLAGVVLSVAGLTTLVYGIIEGPKNGWGDPVTLASLAGGLLLLMAFAAWERRSPHAMLTGSLFRSAQFSGSAVAVVFINICLFGLLFVITQYLQFVLGHDPMAAGLRLLPAVAMLVGAPMGIQLVEKGPGLKVVVTAGLMIVAGSLALLSSVDTSAEGMALISLGLFGFGMGWVMPPCANAILAASPAHQSGAGSAVTDVSIQVGGTLGIALTGSILTTTYASTLAVPPGLPAPAATAVEDSIGGAASVAEQAGGAQGQQLLDAASAAFVDGLADAMTAGAVIALAGALIAAIVLPRKISDVSQSPADVTAADTVSSA